MFTFSDRSKRNLRGVHPDLVVLVYRALERCEIDFAVLEGVRTLDKQKTLVEAGASHTMRSRHLTGHAVDLGAYVDGGIRWDFPLYNKIADAMFKASEPHFQLNWDSYPSW
jgi:peptidoglycan L-alanyl-D-glutamate endopeptidase CwlK